MSQCHLSDKPADSQRWRATVVQRDHPDVQLPDDLRPLLESRRSQPTGRVPGQPRRAIERYGLGGSVAEQALDVVAPTPEQG